MTYRVVVLLAVLALVVGVVLLSAPRQEGASAAAVGTPLHDPGYSATNVHLVQTGTDGKPVYTLDAAEAQQLPNNGLVELRQVELGFRDPDGDEWSGRAARGELAQNSGVVRLDGDVHIFGILPGTNDPTQILTEHLAYDTGTQIVDTRDPVTLVMKGRELKATGLVARLKDRHLQLESAVHGTFSQ